jgi:hypothetical protein
VIGICLPKHFVSIDPYVFFLMLFYRIIYISTFTRDEWQAWATADRR